MYLVCFCTSVLSQLYQGPWRHVKQRIMVTQRILYPKKSEENNCWLHRWKVSVQPFCSAHHNAYPRPWNKDHAANSGVSSMELSDWWSVGCDQAMTFSFEYHLGNRRARKSWLRNPLKAIFSSFLQTWATGSSVAFVSSYKEEDSLESCFSLYLQIITASTRHLREDSADFGSFSTGKTGYLGNNLTNCSRKNTENKECIRGSSAFRRAASGRERLRPWSL